MAAGIVLAGVLATASPRATPAPSGAPAEADDRFQMPGTPSGALARLFTPRHAPAGAYEVTVIDGGIERARQAAWEAARDRQAGAAAAPPPVRKMDPLDLFGEAGAYPHTTVARLYVGRKAEVVRIPVERNGRTVAAITLVSPYPDPTLSRLVEGTMAIVLHLELGELRELANDELASLRTELKDLANSVTGPRGAVAWSAPVRRSQVRKFASSQRQ